MRRNPVVILVVVVAAGLVFALTRDGNDSDVDIETLARKQAQRETDLMSRAENEKTNLDLLAKKGRGQEVPAHLFASPDPGGYWFVGKPNIEAGVEIPFEPGKLPLSPSTAEPLKPNPGFLGADACRSCHEEKYDTFIHTAHYRTSRIAGPDTISGSFAEGQNRMLTANRYVHFTMVEREGEFFQRASFYDWKFDVPFQLIIGSSKMAETYLYWHGERLYQMNCTHLTDPGTWINSPGYVDGDAAYARPIQAACLDCHSTYVELRKPPNYFTPDSLILGISCERCHGPGQQHVDYHKANPEEKKSQHISVPSNLTRQQQLDVCAQCHTSKLVPKVTEAFQFRPGEKLEDHYDPIEGHDESTNSVHTSNQVARLQLSECYKQSEMGCVECHNPHRNERGQVKIFSQRCMKCHESQHCGISERLGAKVADDCISCHMPTRATADIRFETVSGNLFQPLRDHYIRVDQRATEDYLQSIKE